jgi:ABC-type glycerol-3-phosphate transport system substrate-binding protein
MTRLERQVRIRSIIQWMSSRYLTLFYCLTLGLALILALFAIGQRGEVEPSTASSTQTVLTQAATPTSDSLQVPSDNTPTSGPVTPPTPNEKTPSPLGVTTDELKGLQINLWIPWSGSASEVLQTILDEFNRTNPWGITVVTSAYEGFGRLDEAVESALVSDAMPEVLVDYGYLARHWEGSNALVDLNPYVSDPVWGWTNDEQTDFYPAFWTEDLVSTGSTGQTGRLGIPFYRSAYMFFYNQSWGRELGYTKPPANTEEFRQRACAAADYITKQKEKADIGKGGWLITMQPSSLVGWIYAFGGGITNPSGAGYLFNTPGALQAFSYLKDLQSSGCAWYETGVNVPEEFARRHALFLVGSLVDIIAQREAFIQEGNKDEWVVIPFPSKDQPIVVTYGPSILLTRSTPARQLAGWLVIDWLTSPPNQAEWVKMLGTYPTRLSALSYLTETSGTPQQWTQAIALLPIARSEPSMVSWSVMRWALDDAMSQLFDLQFDSDQIPTLLENLDSVAAEIDSQVR